MSTILNPTAAFTLAIGNPITSGTSGSVLFIDSNGQLAQDNAHLKYSSSTTTLTVSGYITSPFGSGTNCERFGAGSGNNSASGNSNICLGNAGSALTTSADNILIGDGAGALQTTGQAGFGQSVCIGTNAGGSLTGNLCVYIGYQAGLNATTGQNNFGLGQRALTGGNAGFTGSDCVAIGQTTMQRATTASGAVAIGKNTLNNLLSGGDNTGVGTTSLFTLTVGTDNTGCGYQALYNLLSGSFNSGLGRNCGASTLSTGSNNTLLGNLSDTAAAGTNYGVALGDSAICQDNELAVGPHIDFETLYGLSSTNAKRQRADLTVSWVSSTDATRKSRLVINAWDTAARECLRCEGSGSVAMVSAFGAAAVVQPTTAGAASTFVANTSAIANDTATWDGYTIGQVVKALRNLGWLA